MIDTIRSYLDKTSYYIITTNNMIYIKNYTNLISITEREIIFNINDKKYIITGTNLVLKRHLNKEMIINGNLESIITYDKN